MNIFSIFHSLDLWNNKIFRAKCETPTEGEHIVNKDYVDVTTTYDTEKAEKYQNPFLQWWMKNVYGKTYKELFDDLLFPRLAPTYTNPALDKFTFDMTTTRTQGVQVLAGKKLMFQGLNYNMRFDVWFKQGDRSSSSTALVRFKYPDHLGISEQVFYSNTTADDFTSIDVTAMTFFPGITVTIEKTYDPAPTKKDTYGDNSIPDEFTKTWTLVEDITDQFYESIWMYPGLWVQKKTTSTPASIVDGSTIAMKTLTDGGYTRTNSMQVIHDEQSYYNVLIPTGLFDNALMYLHYYRDNVVFNKHDLLPPQLLDTENIVHCNITGEDGKTENYTVCNVSLGVFDMNYTARMMFDFIFNPA